MKLITETVEDVDYITEEKNGKKNFYIEGIYMQAEGKNRNGRVYPKSVLENAVNKYVTNQVSRGRAVGELNHPESPTINLDKVSHKIIELNWEGNNVIGKALVLDTPMGQIAKGLMEGGVQLGVSSRGMGSLEMRNGINYVKEDFMLATVDIVQDPSAPEAFVNGIMEGVEYFYDENSGLYRKAEEIKEHVSKLSIRQIAEQQTKLFKDFLNNIG